MTMYIGTDEIVRSDKTAYLRQQGLAPVDTSPPPDTTSDTYVPITGSGLSVDPNNDGKNLFTNLSKFNVFALPKTVTPDQPDRTWMYAAGALAAVAIAALALKRG